MSERGSMGAGAISLSAQQARTPDQAPQAPALYARPLFFAEVGLVALVLGLLGLLLWPIASVPSLYPDSGIALSLSMTLAKGDLGPVWHTQSPPLQDGMYAALLRLGWTSDWAFKLPVVAQTWCLAAWLGIVAFRVSGKAWTASVPVLVLYTSNVFWSQAGYLTMYPGFALAGYAGLYLCVQHQVRPRGWPPLVAGGVLLGLSPYLFTTGVLFSAVPAIAAVCYCSRAVIRRTAAVYLVTLTMLAPWLIWHLLVGGPGKIYYHPLDWFTVKYLGVVHVEFWGYERSSLAGYVREMGQVGLLDVVAAPLLLFIVPGLWYVHRRFGMRAVLLSAGCIAFHLAALVATRPAPFARYYYPLLPLLVLLVSGGIVAVVQSTIEEVRLNGAMTSSGRRQAGVIAAVAVPAFIVVCGILPAAIADAHYRFNGRLDSSFGYHDLKHMAPMIAHTDSGVIGRDASIQARLPDNLVYTHFLVDEEDFVTYLAWRSDSEVVDMFRRHNIGWVILRNDVRWEREFNVWLPMTYGVPVHHFEAIPRSPYFRKAYEGAVYTLYQLLPDGDGAETTTTSPSR